MLQAKCAKLERQLDAERQAGAWTCAHPKLSGWAHTQCCLE